MCVCVCLVGEGGINFFNNITQLIMCVCMCVSVCVSVCACVCVLVGEGGGEYSFLRLVIKLFVKVV